MKKLADISSFESLMQQTVPSQNAVFNREYPKNSEKGYTKRLYGRQLLTQLLSLGLPGLSNLISWGLMKPTRTGFKDGYSKKGKWGRWWSSDWRAALKTLPFQLGGAALGGLIGGPLGGAAGGQLGSNIGLGLASWVAPMFASKARMKQNKKRAFEQDMWLDEIEKLQESDNPNDKTLIEPFLPYLKGRSELREDYLNGKIDLDVYRQLLDRMYQDGEIYKSSDYEDPYDDTEPEIGDTTPAELIKEIRKGLLKDRKVKKLKDFREGYYKNYIEKSQKKPEDKKD